MPVEVLGFDPNLEMTTQAALCSRWSSDLPFLSFFLSLSCFKQPLFASGIQ